MSRNKIGKGLGLLPARCESQQFDAGRVLRRCELEPEHIGSHQYTIKMFWDEGLDNDAITVAVMSRQMAEGMRKRGQPSPRFRRRA